MTIKRALACLGLTIMGVFATLALTLQLLDHHARDQQNTKIVAELQQKARTCHAMRNMGISAYAISMARNGFYFPYRECKELYAILGIKEPKLMPDSQAIEDKEVAKSKAFEAKRKADYDAGRYKWN